MGGDRQGPVLVGVTSWTEKTLIEAGTFYPPDATTPEERLRYYATQFPIVEVDATYYSPPSERVARVWVERTPPEFTFDVKAYRLLTQHQTPPASLWKDVRETLTAEQREKRNVYAKDLAPDALAHACNRFLAALTPLRQAGKLGVLLFQFPHWFLPGRKSLDYLTWIREQTGDQAIAVEFRQPRWVDDEHRDDTLGALRDRDLAYVCVDSPQGFKSSMPPLAAATSDVAVVRFHGRNVENWERRNITTAERFAYDYRPDELAPWVGHIEKLAESGRPVHALMNNCYADYGVRSARLLRRLLDGAD
jgi:uncharacterized protein YecE (DUF72 family)